MGHNEQQIVGSTFRIIRDKKSWVYEKWDDNPSVNPKTGELGKPHWDVVGYYGKLSDVAVYLINSQIKVPAKGFENAAEILAAIKQLEQSLVEQLEAIAKEDGL